MVICHLTCDLRGHKNAMTMDKYMKICLGILTLLCIVCSQTANWMVQSWPSPMVDGLDHSSNILSSTCIIEHCFCFME